MITPRIIRIVRILAIRMITVRILTTRMIITQILITRIPITQIIRVIKNSYIFEKGEYFPFSHCEEK